MKKFQDRFAQVMKESLLEGNADYGDVMDAVGKLKSALDTFQHSYPANRSNDVHGKVKMEIEALTKRVHSWMANHKSAAPVAPQPVLPSL